MSVTDKAILVTGAASGIGLATSLALARKGAHVTGIDIDPQKLEAAEGTPDLAAVAVRWRPGSATVLLDMAEAVDAVVRQHGRIDAVVGCAGLAYSSSSDAGDIERWTEVLVVNALGPMVTARAVLPYMLKQGYGDIVIVTSASGRITYVGEPAYVASKHAAVAFLDSLRKEVASTGIRVTSIEPGLVDTPMSRAHPFFKTTLKDVEPLQAADVAELIEYCLSLPLRVNVNEVVVRPTRQEL